MDLSDYKTKTKLILPFNNEWFVSNGGRDKSKNNHIIEDDGKPWSQAFAYDFIKNHKDQGQQLEDYEAFGSEVVAPAAGVIVRVISGNHDVPIGQTDWVVLTGNTIVIDHENGEWSVLAHLKNNSIAVQSGDHVNQGQVIGLCGNTGNTSEPHIHYHLQDGPEMYSANGLPAQFGEIKVDGNISQQYEPQQGEKVSNV